MSNPFQVCLCGTQPGYLHAPDCPYPLYHALPGSASEAKWFQERAARRARFLEFVIPDVPLGWGRR